MKKKTLILLSLLFALSLILVACKGNTSSSNTTVSSEGTTGAQKGTGLSEVNMLLVGTLKLEGTAQALTADEAAQLLPLWQAYLSLSNSQTAAEEEVNGLLKQIQNTMTKEQVDAIKAMNLTSTDMMTLMQSMGGMGPQGTPNPNATTSFDFPGGSFQSGEAPGNMQPPSGSGGGTRPNFPSGGMQGGGPVIIQGGPGMGGDTSMSGGQVLQGTPDPSMQATAQARFSTQASQVNTMLLNVLISKLQAMTNK